MRFSTCFSGRKRLWSLLAVAALVLYLSLASACAEAPVKLTILFMNDPHAHYASYMVRGSSDPIGGFARAATLFKEIAAENREQGRDTLFLVAGDLLMGTPFSTMFKGSLGFKLLNSMGVTAMVVGNHEFDYGRENLIRDLKGLAKFPLLSANIKTDKGEEVFQRAVEKTLPGTNVPLLIFGLTTDQTPISTHPANVKGLIFEQPVKTAQEVLRSVKPDTIVIALTHLGVEEDIKLAETVPRINVIIGGHSHTELPKALRVNDTVIGQAGSYSKWLGRIDIEFANGKVLNHQGRLIPLDKAVREDPEIASIIVEHQKLLDDKLSVVIGTSEVLLDGRCRWTKPGENTNFGDLVGFAVATASGADAAVYNAGSIRKSIPAGPITAADVYTALPFGNSVVTMGLKGSDLQAVLQRGADLEEGSGGRLQTYGIKYGPADEKVKVDEVAGEPFDPERIYRVATHDFMAAGGDGYTILKDKGVNPYPTAMPLSDLVVDYIKEKKVIR